VDQPFQLQSAQCCKLIAIFRNREDARLPDVARQVLAVLAAEVERIRAAAATL
jgi:hypothetical protein